jgi:hypothetical protein
MKQPQSDFIHIFWIGGVPPEWVIESLQAWKTSYPNRIQFWNESSVITQGWDWVLNQSWPAAMKVDVLRVLAVSKFGGWYVDADSRPLDRFLPVSKKLILVREEGNRCCNGFFYSTQGNEFLEIWLREILRSINERELGNVDIARISGPHALSRALYVHALSVGSIKSKEQIILLPWKYIKFRDQEFANSNRVVRGSVVHYSALTWNAIGAPKKSKLKLQLFQLRLGRASLILDLLRSLLLNPHRFPRSYLHLKLLLNLDSTVLDNKGTWRDVELKIHTFNELHEAVRDINIGIIETSEVSLHGQLRFAGWTEIRRNKWLRPRINQIAGSARGHLTGMTKE